MGLILIESCEVGAREFRTSQVIKTVHLAGDTFNDIPQTATTGQLRNNQAGKLRPARCFSKRSARMMSIREGFEFMSRNTSVPTFDRILLVTN